MWLKAPIALREFLLFGMASLFLGVVLALTADYILGWPPEVARGVGLGAILGSTVTHTYMKP